MNQLPILYEDNHLLVVDKPAEIATMGAESGPTVHSLAADYLKRTYQKPGNVYVGVVSRLDAMTSGVLVLARTSKAASRLVPQFAPDAPVHAKAQKTYLAIVEGQLDATCGILDDFVVKDDQAKRMRVVSLGTQGARRAVLRYHVIDRHQDQTLIAVRLDTGRKHQIRVQFANQGHAILGDRKYKSRIPFTKGIALHSLQLQINHPTRKERMSWTTNPPKPWQTWLRNIGGSVNLSDRVDQLDWHISDEGTAPTA